MKDIFIDANIANKFASPPDKHYEDFIEWLQSKDAWIMISDKLINEYIGGCKLSNKPTCIGSILNLKIIQNNYTKLTTAQIKVFQQQHITKNVSKKLRCNNKDRNHIPLVMLSARKIALSNDDDFLYDILNFPGFNDVNAQRSPEKLPYK